VNNLVVCTIITPEKRLKLLEIENMNGNYSGCKVSLIDLF